VDKVNDGNVTVPDAKLNRDVPVTLNAAVDVNAPAVVWVVVVRVLLTVIGQFNVTPFVVILGEPDDAAKVKAPVYVADTPVLAPVPLNVKLPYMLMAVEPAHVT
jgi:hypothetical protein